MQPLMIAQGQAGVFRVMSELILREFEPSLPAVDTGFDIMLSSGLRIQVKCTKSASKHWRHRRPTFQFSMSKARLIRQGQVTKHAARRFSDYCDFVVLWAIEPSRFWIVPASVLNGRHTVTISEGTPQWRPCDVDRARELRSLGLTYQAIANELGTDVWTIQRRLVKGFSEPKKKYTNLPQYEDRWDLIRDAAVPASSDKHAARV